MPVRAVYSQCSKSSADANYRRLLTTCNINRRLYRTQYNDTSLAFLNAYRSAAALHMMNLLLFNSWGSIFNTSLRIKQLDYKCLLLLIIKCLTAYKQVHQSLKIHSVFQKRLNLEKNCKHTELRSPHVTINSVNCL